MAGSIMRTSHHTAPTATRQHHPPRATSHVPPATCHKSHATRNVSPCATRNVSLATCHPPDCEEHRLVALRRTQVDRHQQALSLAEPAHLQWATRDNVSATGTRSVAALHTVAAETSQGAQLQCSRMRLRRLHRDDYTANATTTRDCGHVPWPSLERGRKPSSLHIVTYRYVP